MPSDLWWTQCWLSWTSKHLLGWPQDHVVMGHINYREDTLQWLVHCQSWPYYGVGCHEQPVRMLSSMSSLTRNIDREDKFGCSEHLNSNPSLKNPYHSDGGPLRNWIIVVVIVRCITNYLFSIFNNCHIERISVMKPHGSPHQHQARHDQDRPSPGGHTAVTVVSMAVTQTPDGLSSLQNLLATVPV